MSSPYIGEIRMFAGNFAPSGWAFCDGTLLPISENESLFTLIGTTYGGDGQNTFALPDLRSRVPIHQGTGAGLTTRNIGESGGVETVTLALTQVPGHSHSPAAVQEYGNQGGPAGATWARGSGPSEYVAATPTSRMDAAAIGATGGGQPHDNMIPYLAINFIISLFGIFPSQT